MRFECFCMVFMAAAAGLTPTMASALEVDSSEQGQGLRDKFGARYRAWVEYTDKHDIVSGKPGENEALVPIIELGLPVVPFVIEKMERNDHWMDFQLGVAIGVLTKKWFEREDWPEGRHGDARSAAAMYVAWWKYGRQRTPALFARFYEEWKKAKESGDEAKAEARARSIRNLGIDALPLLMEKIQAGDGQLAGVVSWLTQPRYVEILPALGVLAGDKVPETATTEQCLAWWKQNRSKWTLPPPDPIGQAATMPAPP